MFKTFAILQLAGPGEALITVNIYLNQA